MRTRIVVGALLSAMLLCALAFGGALLYIIITLFSFAAVYELGKLGAAADFRPILMPAYVFSLLFAFVYMAFGYVALGIFFAMSFLVTMTLTVLLSNRSGKDGIFSLFLYAYPLLPLISVMLCYGAFDRQTGLTAACLAYAAPSFSDTFAYFGGTMFGKHKLCPDISPKKTVEGAAFALAGGLVFGVLLIPLQRLWGGTTAPAALVTVGFLTGLLSQVGDLFASKMKRWANLKDFSTVFPGHGGIMDRLDSILACSPMVLIFFSILYNNGVY